MKKWILAVAILLVGWNKSHSQEAFLIVGTYTGGKSEGIYVYKFNSANGSFREISHVKTPNPSFVVVSPDEKYVYAVNENGDNGNGGQVSSFSFDKEKGVLTPINQQLTKGDHPCYVEVDKTGKWVFAGNYSSGSLSVFPVNPDGSLGAASTHIQHTGSGANKDRQEKPHVHCTYISPDNKWLYVPDLGTDKVMIYAFDAATGKLSAGPQPFAPSQPGSGPRHITFHPNGKYAYLIEELTGNIVTYQYLDGQLKLWQRISSLPTGQKGFAGSADIHVSPDGKFLYASNRGDFNNIAISKLDKKNGRASIIGFHSTMGKAPRNFNLDPAGKYLLVGNQDSNEIVIFKRNTRTGLLTDTKQRIGVGKPVCLKWISTQ